MFVPAPPAPPELPDVRDTDPASAVFTIPFKIRNDITTNFCESVFIEVPGSKNKHKTIIAAIIKLSLLLSFARYSMQLKLSIVLNMSKCSNCY